MASAIIPSANQEKLFYHSLHILEQLYDPHMKLIRSEEATESKEERHSTRDSIHFSLGLLLRNQDGDVEKACDIISTVLDLQFTDEEEIYYGTFRTSPQAPVPPVGHFPWKQLGDGASYIIQSTFEKFQDLWLKQPSYQNASNKEKQQLRAELTSVFDQVIPPVWKSYDPNWREFIASTLAVVLECFETLLPTELVRRIDEAMLHTVQGSIDRKQSGSIPMNTNIELMHLFIADYYGARYDRLDWIAHTKQTAKTFLQDMKEYGTFAEFNSSTYYGVDLTVLGLIRKYSKLEEIRSFGQEVEAQLWQMIALFYNAKLENLCGPFSRAYEMNMLDHSSLGIFLYIALGDEFEHLAADNCELAHNMLVALLDIQLPQQIRHYFTDEQPARAVEIYYRELCERHAPHNRRHPCKVTAWIEPRLMLGGIAGSQNSSGQLHPATIHWQAATGDNYYLRLLRREPNGHWSTHYFGILYDVAVEKRTMEIAVDVHAEHDLEIYFEITGNGLSAATFSNGVWNLPGLQLTIKNQAVPQEIQQYSNRIEHIYTYQHQQGAQQLQLSIEAELTN